MFKDLLTKITAPFTKKTPKPDTSIEDTSKENASKENAPAKKVVKENIYKNLKEQNAKFDKKAIKYNEKNLNLNLHEIIKIFINSILYREQKTNNSISNIIIEKT